MRVGKVKQVNKKVCCSQTKAHSICTRAASGMFFQIAETVVTQLEVCLSLAWIKFGTGQEHDQPKGSEGKPCKSVGRKTALSPIVTSVLIQDDQGCLYL